MWLFMEDKRAIKQLMSNDSFIFDKNDFIYEVAKYLEDKDILEIDYQKFIHCSKKVELKDSNGLLNRMFECREKIYLEKEEKEFVRCPRCSKQNEVNEDKIEIECTSHLNFKGTISYLKRLINENPNYNVRSYKSGAFTIKKTKDDSLLNILIPSLVLCDSNYYFSYNYDWDNNKQPLFIKLRNKSISHVVDNINTIGLWEILKDKKMLYNIMKSSDFNIVTRKKEIEDKLNSFLSKISGQEFEEWVNDVLLKYVQENRDLVDKYLTKLDKDKYTFYGLLPIKVGSSGYTDIKFINKYEYLKQFFYGKRYIIDAKRYTTTRFDRNDLSKIRTHLQEDASIPDKAVVICTSNNIQTNAWNSIYKVRRNKGEWQTIIITKSLLLELLININGLKLLK